METYKGDQVAWENFLNEATQMTGNGSSIRGFLQAVLDCCTVVTQEEKDPAWKGIQVSKEVIKKLEKLSKEDSD